MLFQHLENRVEREKKRESTPEHPDVLFEMLLHNLLAALCTLGVTCSFDMMNSSFDVVDAGCFFALLVF